MKKTKKKENTKSDKKIEHFVSSTYFLCNGYSGEPSKSEKMDPIEQKYFFGDFVYIDLNNFEKLK